MWSMWSTQLEKVLAFVGGLFVSRCHFLFRTHRLPFTCNLRNVYQNTFCEHKSFVIKAISQLLWSIYNTLKYFPFPLFPQNDSSRGSLGCGLIGSGWTRRDLSEGGKWKYLSKHVIWQQFMLYCRRNLGLMKTVIQQRCICCTHIQN